MTDLHIIPITPDDVDFHNKARKHLILHINGRLLQERNLLYAKDFPEGGWDVRQDVMELFKKFGWTITSEIRHDESRYYFTKSKLA